MIEDIDILKQVAKGDQMAFDALFKKYHRYLVSIAYGYTKDLEISRDLSQEVFLDVWKRREKIKVDTSFRAFIRRAVINLSLTKIKSLKNYDQVSEKAMSLPSESDSYSELNYKELSKCIKTTVSSLPERCRRIFELSRYEGKSHKAISAELEISTKTIENQMTKALKKIRLDLKKAGLLVFAFFILRGWEPILILLINHFDL